MAVRSGITERLLVKQKSMFRQAAARGFTQDLIHGETGLSTTSLSDWANGKAKISGVAILALAEFDEFPADLLSLLFSGTGRCVIDEGRDGDHDRLASNCVKFTGKYTGARHPESEAGIEIGPNEDQDLTACSQNLRVA